MVEAGLDVSERRSREICPESLRSCDHVVTMGCSTLDLGVGGGRPEVRDWALEDPEGLSAAGIRAVRDRVEQNVRSLFDDLERRLRASD